MFLNLAILVKDILFTIIHYFVVSCTLCNCASVTPGVLNVINFVMMYLFEHPDLLPTRQGHASVTPGCKNTAYRVYFFCSKLIIVHAPSICLLAR